jgi:hypothetical protein
LKAAETESGVELDASGNGRVAAEVPAALPVVTRQGKKDKKRKAAEAGVQAQAVEQDMPLTMPADAACVVDQEELGGQAVQRKKKKKKKAKLDDGLPPTVDNAANQHLTEQPEGDTPGAQAGEDNQPQSEAEGSIQKVRALCSARILLFFPRWL